MRLKFNEIFGIIVLQLLFWKGWSEEIVFGCSERLYSIYGAINSSMTRFSLPLLGMVLDFMLGISNIAIQLLYRTLIPYKYAAIIVHFSRFQTHSIEKPNNFPSLIPQSYSLIHKDLETFLYSSELCYFRKIR